MEFDWGDGNRDKNLRHGIHDWEIEEAMEDRRGIVGILGYFRGELRREYLGRSHTSGRYLKIVYTIREERGRRYYRPISALEMSREERARYTRRR